MRSCTTSGLANSPTNPRADPLVGVRWRELLADDAEVLAAAGISSPHVDARRIVEEASGRDGGSLLGVLDDEVAKRALAHHDDMVRRRAGGEPLQYVLGRWGFRSLDLAVDPRALIPRPETEQVVEVGLAELDRLGVAARTCRVVDLGTGSGAIALSIAVERLRTEVWATDRSADALALARANLAGIGRPATRVRMVEGDWFEALPDELRGAVDLVISNPPYVGDDDELPDEITAWEPAGALRSGADGLDDVRRIMAGARTWLVPGGALVVELAPDQAPAAIELASLAGFVDVEVLADLSSRPRALRARSPG